MHAQGKPGNDKKLVEQAGGQRKLSSWIRKKLEVEKHE